MALISSLIQSPSTTIVTRSFDNMIVGGTTALPTYYGISTINTIPSQDFLLPYIYYAIINITYFDASQVQLMVVDAHGDSYATAFENWQTKINTPLPNGYLVVQCNSTGGNSDLVKQQISGYGEAIYFMIYLQKLFGNKKLTENSTIKNIVFITNVNFNGVRMSYDSNNLVYFVGHSSSYPLPRLFSDSFSICKMMALHQMFANTSNIYPTNVSLDYLAFVEASTSVYATLITNLMLIAESAQSNFIFTNLASEVFNPYYINYPDVYPDTYNDFIKDASIVIDSSNADIFNLNQNQNDSIFKTNVNSILKSFYLFVIGSDGPKIDDRNQPFNIVSALEQFGISPIDSTIYALFVGLFIANMLFTTPLYNTNYNRTIAAILKISENALAPFTAVHYDLFQSLNIYYDTFVANFAMTFANMMILNPSLPFVPSLVDSIFLDIRNACNFYLSSSQPTILTDELAYVLSVPQIHSLKIIFGTKYVPKPVIIHPAAIKIEQIHDIITRLERLQQSKYIRYVDFNEYAFKYGSNNYVVKEQLAKPFGISQVPDDTPAKEY
jgi:hypothetical protein